MPLDGASFRLTDSALAVGPQVHVRELPYLARIADPALETPRLLVRADLQPVLEEENAGVDHGSLDQRCDPQESLDLLFRAEAHDPLDARTVVPATIEDHDLASGGQVWDVPLHVHLGPFPLRWGRKGDDAEHPWAHPL